MTKKDFYAKYKEVDMYFEAMNKGSIEFKGQIPNIILRITTTSNNFNIVKDTTVKVKDIPFPSLIEIITNTPFLWTSWSKYDNTNLFITQCKQEDSFHTSLN